MHSEGIIKCSQFQCSCRTIIPVVACCLLNQPHVNAGRLIVEFLCHECCMGDEEFFLVFKTPHSSGTVVVLYAILSPSPCIVQIHDNRHLYNCVYLYKYTNLNVVAIILHTRPYHSGQICVCTITV